MSVHCCRCRSTVGRRTVANQLSVDQQSSVICYIEEWSSSKRKAGNSRTISHIFLDEHKHMHEKTLGSFILTFVKIFLSSSSVPSCLDFLSNVSSHTLLPPRFVFFPRHVSSLSLRKQRTSCPQGKLWKQAHNAHMVHRKNEGIIEDICILCMGNSHAQKR